MRQVLLNLDRIIIRGNAVGYVLLRFLAIFEENLL